MAEKWFYSSYDQQYHPASWFATPPTTGGYDKPPTAAGYYSESDQAYHPASWFAKPPTAPLPGGAAPAATTAAATATPATTVNPVVLNALTLQYGRERAELDDQQNRRRINYNSALGKMGRSLKDTQITSRESFADRGMLHAGASLANQVKLRDEYNRSVGDLTTGYNTDLSSIARRRLESQAKYASDTTLAKLGLGG